MKCPKCKGIGAVQIAPNVRDIIKCDYCNGKGEIESSEAKQMRLNYLQKCSVVELSEIISLIARSCYACGEDVTAKPCPFSYCLLADLGAEAWLKEINNGINKSYY